MQTRFNGNVVPFANDATSTNRTVFGGTTQSDNIDDNLNADFKKGWEIVGLNDSPTREDFNAMGYTLGALTSYLYQMGIAEYNALQEYKLNGLCLGTDGTIYQSLVDSNIGNALTNGTKWKNVTSSFVNLVNNQSIDGIKTFVKSPIVPTPTAGNQAATKDYVDSKPNLPIGAILNGYTIFDNCIVAFGGEFNRADYPKLWAYLQANPSLLKTQAQWTTETTTNGGICGFYSDGDGTTTFRVPNLDKAFLRPGSRSIGSFEEGSYTTGDSNLTSPFVFAPINYDDNQSSFKARINWDNLAPVQIGNNNLRAVGIFSTSIYSYDNSPEYFGVARPKNIAVLPLIVAK